MARREIVERVGGFEETFTGLYEDQVFYAKMLLAAPVYVSSRLWDKYRIHPESMCVVAEREHEIGDAYLQYLNWLEKYLSERGLTPVTATELLKSQGLTPARNIEFGFHVKDPDGIVIQMV